MAFGGVPVYVQQGSANYPFHNMIEITGLTLSSIGGLPLTIADPGVGQLTTGVPGVNQVGIPANWARGRGNWEPGDESAVNQFFELHIDPATGIVATPGLVDINGPGTGIEVVGGDLVITVGNIIAVGAPATIHLHLIFLHTIII